ncbi:MAG: hypothetical protein MJZ32_10880 [Bacteroidaceae bacterium]|nr:hypothetical protein [Bacteroidaceae bacterium]
MYIEKTDTIYICDDSKATVIGVTDSSNISFYIRNGIMYLEDVALKSDIELFEDNGKLIKR